MVPSCATRTEMAPAMKPSTMRPTVPCMALSLLCARAPTAVLTLSADVAYRRKAGCAEHGSRSRDLNFSDPDRAPNFCLREVPDRPIYGRANPRVDGLSGSPIHKGGAPEVNPGACMAKEEMLE